MLSFDASNVQPNFRSQLRITQLPNRTLKPGIKKEPGERIKEEELQDVIEWRWHATTNAKDRTTQSETGTGDTYGHALTQAKAELAKQFTAIGLPASELAYLDHLE